MVIFHEGLCIKFVSIQKKIMSIYGFNTVFYIESLVCMIRYLKGRYQVQTIVDCVVNTKNNYSFII